MGSLAEAPSLISVLLWHLPWSQFDCGTFLGLSLTVAPSLISVWLWHLPWSQFGCGTFLDLSKVFDSIDHNILVCKLRHNGIRGSPLSLPCNYLSNRKQYVCTNGFQYEIRENTCGAPQGSISVPLLFVIYINDVYLASSHFRTTVYADDTTLFSSGDNLGELIDKTETEF